MKKKQARKKNGFRIKPWMIETALYAVTALVFYILLFTTKLLPVNYLVAIAFVLAALGALIFALTRYQKKKVRFMIGTILAVLCLIVNCLAGFYINKTVSVLRSVAGANTEKYSVTFYTLAENEAENLTDLQNGTFGILTALDRENTDEAIANVERKDGFTLNTVEYASLTELADAILNHEVDAIVMNEAYLGIYEDTPGYEDFASKLKVISTEIIEKEVETVDASNQRVFTVLISGSDTRNEYLDTNGRSDVNILAVINRDTHRILLVSTPRDYFVELAIPGVSGAMDKLTHAGIYGMDVSKNTIGNLYGIAVDYYFRVNFTGFVDIIDALGGVDVYSEYAFSSQGYSFSQGINTLGGEAALAFSRERYSFSGGDRQRGTNQMEVIKAALTKAMSPAILNSYSSILQSVQGCVDMSIPYGLIAGIVNDQLNDNASWTIESMSVDGTGAYSTTYSMAQQLYVMIPDQATVDAAKAKITEVEAIDTNA